MVFSRMNKSYREKRKLLERGLRPGTLPLYRPVLEARVHDFLVRVLAHPDELESHIHQFVGFPLCHGLH